jgi:sortase A
MRTGDVFNIYVLGEKHIYRVDKISTCLPTETDALRVVSGEDMVTLMTCVPYGINTHRLFVRGVRCLYDGNDSALDLVSARRREYVRSVLSIMGMFLISAAETAFYTLHIHKTISRIKLKKRSML